MEKSHPPHSRCRVCGSELSARRLDLGNLPASNRFDAQAVVAETHRICVGQCAQCGLVQLDGAPPPSFVLPRVPWISYREPEVHLDDLVERLTRQRPDWPRTVIGTSTFDGPLTTRLAARGTTASALPPPTPYVLEDGTDAYPYLETIQAALEPGALARAAKQLGTADLVCCRYLLEHCHTPVAALHGLRALMAEGGLLLVEIPDSTKFLVRHDFSFIWEEHVSYFTAATFRAAAAYAGFEMVELVRYEGALEDALVGLLRPTAKVATGTQPDPSDLAAFAAFAAAFEPLKKNYQAQLGNVIGNGGKVALLGAGHQGIMFVNALELQDYVSIVADDAPTKAGRYPSGLAVSVEPSSAIIEDAAVRLVLLSVAPGIEPIVREKLTAVTARGGAIKSIFQTGAKTLDRAAAP